MRSLIVLLAALAPASTALAQAAPDLVLLNARVCTGDPHRPWADAVAIAGDRIVAAGATAEIRTRIAPNTRAMDLAGALVSPGVGETHVHIDATGARLVGVNLLAVQTGPAWVSFEEAVTGTIEPGKLAGLAVFDTSPIEAWRANRAALLKAAILYTIVAGRVVYEGAARADGARIIL